MSHENNPVSPAVERPSEPQFDRAVESLVTLWWKANGMPDVDGERANLVRMERQIKALLALSAGETPATTCPDCERMSDEVDRVFAQNNKLLTERSRLREQIEALPRRSGAWANDELISRADVRDLLTGKAQ